MTRKNHHKLTLRTKIKAKSFGSVTGYVHNTSYDKNIRILNSHKFHNVENHYRVFIYARNVRYFFSLTVERSKVQSPFKLIIRQLYFTQSINQTTQFLFRLP
jgi:hypothetical protein